MDAFGFAFASAFLATAFTIFGVVGRILDGVAGELRYTIAPTIVDGMRAWGDELRDTGRTPASGTAPDDADGRASTGGGSDGDASADRRDPGAVVKMQALPGRSWHLFGRLVHGLAMTRRRTHAHT